ncbi:MAG: HAD-IB family phosphatase [Theionarchaea archaeon]|nr:HAD-IB family phosphatase [Theionarchaea archaeon]
MIRVVAFDMDGTLISESSWELLHTYFQADREKIMDHRNAYFSNYINYETWMERDISLWNSPTLADVYRGLSAFTLEPHAGMVVAALKDRNIIPCIISSGVSILAHMIGQQLGIDPSLVHANDLICVNGQLKGVMHVEPHKKDVVISRLSQRLSIPPREFAAVGDAAPDVSLFKLVGLRLAYNPRDETIMKTSDFVLNSLKDILNLL